MDMKKLLGILLLLVGLVGLVIGAMESSGTAIIKPMLGKTGALSATYALVGLVFGVIILLIGLFFLKDMFLGKKAGEEPAPSETTEAPSEAPAEEKTEEATEEKKEETEEATGKKEEYECPSCGATVPGDSTVCPECGEEFEE